jgi:hypothetical protein
VRGFEIGCVWRVPSSNRCSIESAHKYLTAPMWPRGNSTDVTKLLQALSPPIYRRSTVRSMGLSAPRFSTRKSAICNPRIALSSPH